MKKKLVAAIFLAVIIGIGFSVFNIDVDVKDNKNYIVKEKFLEIIDETSEARDNEVIIKKDNKFGVINIENETVLDLIYDYILRIDENLYFIQMDEIKKLWNTKLNKSIKLDEVSVITEGIFRVKYKGKYGLFDKDLNEIISIEKNFIDGNSENILVFSGDTINLYDKSGKYKKLKNKYEKVKLGIGKYLYAKKNGLWGIINTAEKVIVDFKYDSFLDLNDKDVLVGYVNDESYLINLQGEKPLELKAEYDNYGVESCEKIMVLKKGKIGYIDVFGEEIISSKYDGGFSFKEDKNFIQVKEGDSWKILDLSGKEIKELDINDLGEYIEGYMILEKDGKYGYIDELGDIKIPLEYDFAENFSNGLAIVAGEYGYGVIDKENHQVLPLKYDAVQILGDKIYVTEGGKYGLFSIKGDELIHPEFEYLNKVTDNIIFFRNDKTSGFIELIREDI